MLCFVPNVPTFVAGAVVLLSLITTFRFCSPSKARTIGPCPLFLIHPTLRDMTTQFEETRVRPEATHDSQTSQNLPSPADFSQKCPPHCPDTRKKS